MASVHPAGEAMDAIRALRNMTDDLKARDAERFAVSVPVTLRPEGLRMVLVSVGDISATGFMARTDEPIALGAHVSVDLPGVGPTQARVRWTVGARVGARFAEPIDVAHCRAEMMKAAEPA